MIDTSVVVAGLVTNHEFHTLDRRQSALAVELPGLESTLLLPAG